jgi:hypothetical protein
LLRNNTAHEQQIGHLSESINLLGIMSLSKNYHIQF